MRSFSGFRDSDTGHSLLQHTSHAGPNPPFQNGVFRPSVVDLLFCITQIKLWWRFQRLETRVRYIHAGHPGMD